MSEEKFCPEIHVTARVNGEIREPATSYLYPDASIHFVGKITRGDAAELEVTIPCPASGTWIYAIETPGKIVAQKKNWANNEGQLVYRKKITIHRDPMLYVGHYTRPNGGENFFRILVLQGDYLKHIEVSLISQKGKFFVGKQLTRQGRVYRDKNDQVIFPKFSDWPEMTEFLTGLMIGEKLEPMPDNASNDLPAIEPEELTGNTAETVWWSLTQQIGMVIDCQGRTARIHWENLKRPGSELAYLAPHEVIRFEKIGPPRQNPERKTTFKWEIFGAEIIKIIKRQGQ
ncbi:MAG: hypothetical protein COV85_04330 [Candidatus Portnoybacteria bacterium CG11_big_fil_rev_8_21_14_0_20_44_10]|uniref:Uncharacterized protein n=3 Tax=Candidatus Portnoyibacteriota TaxID=1817913 RepID=A0A2H0KPG6_9BACT|nr:MAG: hypothetical protein COV85_04330 [Candidatus Portnoybacteria bacterium CG11_big_fil_rev_8_21_14_0_20_44_10]